MDRSGFAARVAKECEKPFKGDIYHAPGLAYMAVSPLAHELFVATDEPGEDWFMSHNPKEKDITSSDAGRFVSAAVGGFILRQHRHRAWSINGYEAHVHPTPQSECRK